MKRNEYVFTLCTLSETDLPLDDPQPLCGSPAAAAIRSLAEGERM